MRIIAAKTKAGEAQQERPIGVQAVALRPDMHQRSHRYPAMITGSRPCLGKSCPLEGKPHVLLVSHNS
jgi:hypothetical protein